MGSLLRALRWLNQMNWMVFMTRPSRIECSSGERFCAKNSSFSRSGSGLESCLSDLSSALLLISLNPIILQHVPSVPIVQSLCFVQIVSRTDLVPVVPVVQRLTAVQSSKVQCSMTIQLFEALWVIASVLLIFLIQPRRCWNHDGEICSRDRELA